VVKRSVMVAFLLAGLVLFSLAAGGCEPEEEEPEVDQEALVAINNYVEEISALLPEVKIDLQGWSRDPHSEDDMPFEYDQERREWLLEHKEELEAVREEHLDAEFPEEEEIAAWDVIIVRGDREWQLDGEEWLAALERLEDLVDEVMDVISMILAEEGELDREQSERVLELIEVIEPEIEAVRAVIFRS